MQYLLRDVNLKGIKPGTASARFQLCPQHTVHQRVSGASPRPKPLPPPSWQLWHKPPPVTDKRHANFHRRCNRDWTQASKPAIRLSFMAALFYPEGARYRSTGLIPTPRLQLRYCIFEMITHTSSRNFWTAHSMCKCQIQIRTLRPGSAFV